MVCGCSTDARPCCICLGSIGWFDRVVHLEKCGHRLHERCHTQLITHQEPLQGRVHNPLTAPTAHRCPLCRATYENNEEDVTLIFFPDAPPCARGLCSRTAGLRCTKRTKRRARKKRRLSSSVRSAMHQFALHMLKLLLFFTLMRVVFACRRNTQDSWLSFQFTCDGGVILGITGIFYVTYSIVRYGL